MSSLPIGKNLFSDSEEDVQVYEHDIFDMCITFQKIDRLFCEFVTLGRVCNGPCQQPKAWYLFGRKHGGKYGYNSVCKNCRSESIASKRKMVQLSKRATDKRKVKLVEINKSVIEVENTHTTLDAQVISDFVLDIILEPSK